MKRATPLIALALAALTFAACGDDDDTPDDSGATEITGDAPANDTSGGTETTAMGAEITMPGSIPEMSEDEARQAFTEGLAGLGIEVSDDQVDCVFDGAEEAGIDLNEPSQDAFAQTQALLTECGIDFASAAGG